MINPSSPAIMAVFVFPSRWSRPLLEDPVALLHEGDVRVEFATTGMITLCSILRAVVEEVIEGFWCVRAVVAVRAGFDSD